MPEQEPQVSSPTGNEPVVIPMEDPAAAVTRPTITADSPPGGSTDAQNGVQGKGAAPQETEAEYWKRIALENREGAEKFNAYSPLINHLETNPDHVSVLQAATQGQAIGIVAADNMAQSAEVQQGLSEEDQLAAELGLANDPQLKANPVANAPKQQRQMTEAEAIQYGREQERVKSEFNAFRGEMAEKGVPDHAVDEFVQYLRSPTALSYSDLFIAYTNYRERTAGTRQTQEPQVPTTPQAQGDPVVGNPVSVTSMPAGHSDRPDKGHYAQEGSGEKFVADPANI